MASTETAAERRGRDRLYINGEWVDPGGDRFPTLNPGTGEVLAEVPEAGEAEVNAAVEAARAALSGPWGKMDAADRAALLWKMGDVIEARGDDFARLEVLDNGKPLREVGFDVQGTVDAFRYYAGWATKLEGETIPVRTRVLNYTLREPVGVVAGIIPWNFPMQMAAWKAAPALACGNAIILKPAEQTPLTALELAAVAEEVGIPPGVFNVLTGHGETTGAALVRHPGVDKVAFTGSTAVGRTIMREAAGTLKRVSLELGGKSPNIVFDDADLDAAARGAFNAIFYNAGQCCTAGSRLLVHESVHDQLLEKLVERAGRLEPDEALNPKRRYGPLISGEQLDRVLGYVRRGREEGAELVTGGERAVREGFENGYWIQPTVFDRVRPDAAIAREEIFGPVLAAMTFSDEEEAIALANDTEYGLAGAVWTNNIKRGHRVAGALQAGTVWVNTYHPLDTASPFGGYKQSGFGRELGRHALDLYTQVKSVWVDLH